MMILLFLLALLIAGLACAFIRVSAAAWVAVTAIVGLAFTVFGQPGWVTLILFWLLFIPVAAILVNRSWRRQFITARALDAFAKMTPQISETEQIAQIGRASCRERV